MNFKFHHNTAMGIAVVLGELVSMLFYFRKFPWVRAFMIGDRYLLPAIICDTGLVSLLKLVMENFWDVKTPEEMMVLSGGCGLMYLCFESPHVPHNQRILVRFFLHALHKLTLVFVMCWALVYFKDY
ncbi:hypothetical protein V1264_023991 [Littorina saxatilis]